MSSHRSDNQPTTYGGNMTRSVTKERKRTSHGLHLFLTIITAGVWGLLVWLPITMWHKVGPKKKAVTVTHATVAPIAAPLVTPPGWYQAPTDAPGVKRWWDGQQWTSSTMPTPVG